MTSTVKYSSNPYIIEHSCGYKTIKKKIDEETCNVKLVAPWCAVNDKSGGTKLVEGVFINKAGNWTLENNYIYLFADPRALPPTGNKEATVRINRSDFIRIILEVMDKPGRLLKDTIEPGTISDGVLAEFKNDTLIKEKLVTCECFYGAISNRITLTNTGLTRAGKINRFIHYGLSIQDTLDKSSRRVLFNIDQEEIQAFLKILENFPTIVNLYNPLSQKPLVNNINF